MEQMFDAIRAYGLDNPKIFDAMRAVPRALFVPPEYGDLAYMDSPLLIGHEQTISQPFTVAFMLDNLLLREGHKVLEIGAGSGWNAALLKSLVGDGHVTAVEYVKALYKTASENIKKTGLDVEVIHDDGSLGYEKQAPYDRIIATCSAPAIPNPWKEQLKPDGIIIAVVGEFAQKMIKWQDGREEVLGDFAFVLLKGKLGFG